MIAASEYPTKLLTAFAAGSGPDLFNTAPFLVAQYYNARILAPIDYAAMGYADEAALTSQYLTGFDGIRFGGKLYGVPTEVSNYACLRQQRDVEGGGPRPRPGLSRRPGRKCRRSPRSSPSATPMACPFAAASTSTGRVAPRFWLTLNTMMHQLGANMVDEAAYKATFDGPEARR